MKLKAVVQSSYELICRWVVKQKYSNCQWTWTPWLDPCVPFMCTSRDFRQGVVGRNRLCHFFVCRQCGPWSGTTDPNCLKRWRYFWLHFLETKMPIRPVVRRLVWAFVVPMYQRWISRDKVHTIFENSKLNVKIYIRYTPGVYAEGCIVFVFPFVRSSFPILVRSFVIPLINCSLSLSLSLSLSADADPESFDSDIKKIQCHLSWWGERGSKYHKSGPSSARQQNAFSDCPALNAGLVTLWILWV